MVEVKQLANIASNAAAPVMGQSLALGTVEYVLLEAAVSMLLRRVIKAPRRSFLQEVALHTISLPFLGGLGAPFGKTRTYNDTYTKQVIDGSKGIPAVFLAQYVQATAANGFHLPSLSVNDVVITAVSKTLTRPATKAIFDFAPYVIREHIERIRLLVGRQENASLLANFLVSQGFVAAGPSSGGLATTSYIPARQPRVDRGPYGQPPGAAGGASNVGRAFN